MISHPDHKTRVTPTICDRCGQTVDAEAHGMGWPVTMEDGLCCPTCYGDEAFCDAGHVLPAVFDSGECQRCAADDTP